MKTKIQPLDINQRPGFFHSYVYFSQKPEFNRIAEWLTTTTEGKLVGLVMTLEWTKAYTGVEYKDIPGLELETKPTGPKVYRYKPMFGPIDSRPIWDIPCKVTHKGKPILSGNMTWIYFGNDYPNPMPQCWEFLFEKVHQKLRDPSSIKLLIPETEAQEILSRAQTQILLYEQKIDKNRLKDLILKVCLTLGVISGLGFLIFLLSLLPRSS